MSFIQKFKFPVIDLDFLVFHEEGFGKSRLICLSFDIIHSGLLQSTNNEITILSIIHLFYSD